MPKGPGKTNPLEYLFRIGIPAVIIWGAIKLFNAVAPTLIEAIKNTWILIGIGAPLAFLILYIVSNPMLIWMSIKNISRKITAAIIKMDPLSFMDRYVEILRKKKANLDMVRTQVLGKKTKLDRFIEEKEASIKRNLQLGEAALKAGESNSASTYGIKVQSDQNSLDALKPLQDRMVRSINFMNALSDNWSNSIDQLAYQVENKRREFEVLKATYGGLKQAEAFIRSDDEAANVFKMSLNALEESVTQKIAYIDQFEKDAKGLMTDMKVERQMISDQGLKKLEQYMEDGKLKLPDFNKVAQGKPVDLKYNTASNSYGL